MPDLLETNTGEWTEARDAATPTVNRLNDERWNTVQRFMAGLPTYGPDSQTPIPQPTITSLTPNEHECEDVGLINMVVTGTNFIEGTTILWGGQPERTDYLSPTQVHTYITTGLFLVPQVWQVSVRNGDKVSAELPFSFVDPAEPPEEPPE